MSFFIRAATTLFLIHLLFITTSCVAKREQFVNNQIYTCTKGPAMSVQVREDLKFIGSVEGNDTLSSPDFADTVQKELFVFGETKDYEITKALLFASETLSDTNARFVQKGCQQVDESYYFHNDYVYEGMMKKCRLVGIVNDGFIDNQLNFKAADTNGEYFSGGYLFELFRSVVNGYRTAFDVIYMESIEINGNTPWKTRDPAKLSGAEKARYHEFLKNAKAAYTKISPQ